MDALAASIALQGLLVPMVVRPSSGGQGEDEQGGTGDTAAVYGDLLTDGLSEVNGLGREKFALKRTVFVTDRGARLNERGEGSCLSPSGQQG